MFTVTSHLLFLSSARWQYAGNVLGIWQIWESENSASLLHRKGEWNLFLKFKLCLRSWSNELQQKDFEKELENDSIRSEGGQSPELKHSIPATLVTGSTGPWRGLFVTVIYLFCCLTCLTHLRDFLFCYHCSYPPSTIRCIHGNNVAIGNLFCILGKASWSGGVFSLPSKNARFLSVLYLHFSPAYLIQVYDVHVLAVDLGEDKEVGSKVHGSLENSLPSFNRLESYCLEARPALKINA